MAAKVTMLFYIKLREGKREIYYFLILLNQHQHTAYNPLVKNNYIIPPKYKGRGAENIAHGWEIISKQ